MLVLLIFFRNTFNFYKKNKWLKTGVIYGAANYHTGYFCIPARLLLHKEFGLPIKRIGVLFFLLLVIAGLFTVFF